MYKVFRAFDSTQTTLGTNDPATPYIDAFKPTAARSLRGLGG